LIVIAEIDLVDLRKERKAAGVDLKIFFISLIETEAASHFLVNGKDQISRAEPS